MDCQISESQYGGPVIHTELQTVRSRAEGAQQLADDRGNGVRDPAAEKRVLWSENAPGER
uniref:Uncharacterized protein n=1 Tax=Anguilla anguilla TaxID=7936 RepID=A0A0E9PQC4_ANGAN